MTPEIPDTDCPNPAGRRTVDRDEAHASLADEAILSALGLLEASDRAAFDRAFADADAATRSRLREIEASWAVPWNLDSPLRDRELPDPALRARVLEAVRREAADASSLPPTTAGAGEYEDLRGPLQGLVEQIREQQESTRRTRNAPWLWRAASLTLAAGLLVSAWFQVRLSDRVAAIAELSMQRQTDEQLRRLIGPGLDRFLAGRTRVVGLGGATADIDGSATLLLDPEAGDGFLLAFGLEPQQGPYVLRALDEAGATTLLSFDPQTAAGGFRISKDRLAGTAGMRFEIADASGNVILRSA